MDQNLSGKFFPQMPYFHHPSLIPCPLFLDHISCSRRVSNGPRSPFTMSNISPICSLQQNAKIPIDIEPVHTTATAKQNRRSELLKTLFIKYFPFTGKYKRFLVALLHAWTPIKKTYAQQREDILLLQIMTSIQPRPEIDYVDVGANHPSDISNTYLLYRNGFTGYLIEPNSELCHLLRRFRPLDRVLNLAIGLRASVAPFFVSRTPVGSTFDENHMKSRKYLLDRVDYVPVLPLDDVFSAIPSSTVGILSIDVEGWNLQAIISAAKFIKRCYVLCIEYDTPLERSKILELVRDFDISFDVIHDNDCNLIFQRNLSE